jgi:hypothetical protein
MTKPLQVYLDESDVARLDAWARARGWTKSQAVRVAVRALTHQSGEDPLLAASGMIDGLPKDLSVHFDRYLERTHVVAPSRARPSKRARPRVRR